MVIIQLKFTVILGISKTLADFNFAAVNGNGRAILEMKTQMPFPRRVMHAINFNTSSG